MKITLTTLSLIALFFLGCADTPLSPIKNDNHSYQLIKLPKKSGMSVENTFFETKEIDGKKGGKIKLNETYIAGDGHIVKIRAKLKFKKNSFQGKVTITLTVDDEAAAISFIPEGIVFNKPAELDLKFEGIDLLNLISGTYDFVYIDKHGNFEIIAYNALHVDETLGKIWVTKAKLHHFSRYGFVH